MKRQKELYDYEMEKLDELESQDYADLYARQEPLSYFEDEEDKEEEETDALKETEESDSEEYETEEDTDNAADFMAAFESDEKKELPPYDKKKLHQMFQYGTEREKKNVLVLCRQYFSKETDAAALIIQTMNSKTESKAVVAEAGQQFYLGIIRFINSIIPKRYPTYYKYHDDIRQAMLTECVSYTKSYNPAISKPSTYFNIAATHAAGLYITTMVHKKKTHQAKIQKEIKAAIDLLREKDLPINTESIHAYCPDRTYETIEAYSKGLFDTETPMDIVNADAMGLMKSFRYSPEKEYLEKESCTEFWETLKICLNDTEFKILALKFNDNDNPSMKRKEEPTAKEIAEKLSISTSEVNQAYKHAKDKIERYYINKGKVFQNLAPKRETNILDCAELPFTEDMDDGVDFEETIISINFTQISGTNVDHTEL